MSDDSTTMMIRRRIRNWKTSIAGLASLICPVVVIFLPPEWAVKILSASAVLSGAVLVAADDPGQNKLRSVIDQVKTLGGKLPCAFLLSILAVGAALPLVSGCSSFRSCQREEAPDGSIRETTINARTFWDAQSDLAKLRASTTDKTQGMTIGALGQESSATNVVALIESVVGAAVRAAAKP